MKILTSILSTALLAYAAGIFLPWWGVAIAGLIAAAWLQQKPAMAFLLGFLSVFLLWAGFAFVRSQLNNDILAHRFSLLILKNDSPILLVLLTGAIGGLTAGLGALSGSLLHLFFIPRKEETPETPEPELETEHGS